jgi:hypothetical protein
MGVFRSQSYDSLPVNKRYDGKIMELTTYEEDLSMITTRELRLTDSCDIEMQSLGMAASPNATCESLSAPLQPAEFQSALQTVLQEKQMLASLLKKYQKLAVAYRNYDHKRFMVAMEQSFRRRASTVEGCVRPAPVNQSVETDRGAEFELDITDADETCTESNLKVPEWNRRPSESSSILYAGVEMHVPPARPPTRITRASIDVAVEAGLIATAECLVQPLEAITRLSKGGWLYKYPRRHYAKLMSQPTIPTAQLSWRYFWLNPHRGLLLWSADPSSNETKQVPVLDYFTERRMLPGEIERDEMATIIVILTGQEKSLALVPASNEDLALWLAALADFSNLRRDRSWPDNLAICSIESLA